MYLEGGELLRITGETLLRFDLHTGMDIPEETVVELRKISQRYQLRSRAAQMASARMLSKKEVTKRLQRRGATEDEAADTADWLEELGAVDDEAYAAAIVRHYGRGGNGLLRVRQELQRRGIDRSLWDAALEEMPPAEEAIAQVLESKLKGRVPDANEGKKLTNMLQRRGFLWQEIRPVLEQFLGGRELPED